MAGSSPKRQAGDTRGRGWTIAHSTHRSLDVVVERKGRFPLPLLGDVAPLAPQASQFPGAGARYHEPGGVHGVPLEGAAVLDHEAPGPVADPADHLLKPDKAAG